MFEFDNNISAAADKAVRLCSESFERIEENTRHNQLKMLKAFQSARVSESMFSGSSGYGYDDRGRDALEQVFAAVFESEDALVRHNFVSGTHALTVALFAVLRPGDTMLCVTGKPYDTIRGTIGIDSDYPGSLKDFGVKYDEIPLKSDGSVDIKQIEKTLSHNKPKMVYIQRSRGYELRPSLLCKDICSIAATVKRLSPMTIVMLDNCYGEFVEKIEPLSNGVDLMAGSLIKNPGGGVARTGGYIAGKKELVEMAAYRLTTPGTGKELGATLGMLREMFMGAYNAPIVTGEALKTASFAAALFELLGYEAFPRCCDERGDIIQVIKTSSADELIRFCRAIQHCSPVDSFVTPEPSDMPGYDCKVIMAAGAFTLGSSIELSCDAPLREPFAVWMQGAHDFHTGKFAVMSAAQSILSKV